MTEEKKEKQKKIELRKEIKERTTGYILAALGLVAGLAWNEAIKALIEGFFPFSKDGVLIKFIYAITVTLLIVVVTVYLLKFTHKEEKK
jgi:hypothetical protein